MVSHEELMAARVAFYERVLMDLLEVHFSERSDPFVALNSYVNARSEPPMPTDAFEERAALVYEEVRTDFFDRLRCNLESRIGRQS